MVITGGERSGASPRPVGPIPFELIRWLEEYRMADHNVDYLRRLRAAVDDFSAAFDDWMATQVESDMVTSRGLFPTI